MGANKERYMPYHINFDKALNPQSFNPDYADCYHKHDETGVIRTIYKEPYAFYFTDEDKTYYSEEELRMFSIVQNVAIKNYEAELKIKT